MMAFRVRTDQIEALQRVALDRYVEELAAHGRAHFPTIAATAGDAGLRRVAAAAMARARGRGFAGRAALRCWYETALLLGLEFDEDPAYAHLSIHWDMDAARAALRPPQDGSVPEGIVSGDGEPDEILMMDGLHDACWDFLDAAVGPDFAALYKGLARLGPLLRPGDDGAAPIDGLRSLDDMIALSERVMPEKAAALGPDRLRDCLDHAARRAADAGLAGGDRAAWALAAFIAGSGFLRDPGLGVDGATPADRLPGPGSTPEERGAALRQALAETARRLVAAARDAAAMQEGR